MIFRFQYLNGGKEAITCIIIEFRLLFVAIKCTKYCEINVVPVLLIQADTLQKAKEFMENQGGRGDED